MSFESKLIFFFGRFKKSFTYRFQRFRNKFISIKKQRLSGQYRFINRSRQQESVLIILCGYKKELWPFVFQRIKLFTPPNVDICLVCPGFSTNEYLEKIAKTNEWSILLNEANKLGIAQNHAINNHPYANWIYKMDEDIFLTEGYFNKMNILLCEINNLKIDFGFIAPLINLNGFSSKILLETLNLLEDFESSYGEINQSCMDTPVWSNPKAAKYIWKNCGNIDTLAQKVLDKCTTYSICNQQFSIGAILFSREIWNSLNYFSDSREKELGMDEVQICEYCFSHNKKIIVSQEILVGHFSFNNQTNEMLKCLDKNTEIFEVNVR